MNIVLGVAGGIAAYKAVEVLRLLTEAGHSVQVMPTRNALRFVGKPTWEALSGRPVSADVFDEAADVNHVVWGQKADLALVVPATADLLARAAHGIADDLLTNFLLMTRAPVLYAPAMHTEMWEHLATQSNVDILRRRGAVVLEPAVGRLTGADSGKGRLPDPSEIAFVAQRVLRRSSAVTQMRPADLAGKHVVVTAGGTREYLDPVRFVGNRSSGRQGYALARTAVARGARVTLIAANTQLPDPAGADVTKVVSAADLQSAALEAALRADAVVMAAAPADFRPVKRAEHKIKKSMDGSAPVLEQTQNPDILRELVAQRAGGGANYPTPQVIVGFAAETGDEHASALEYAQRKLAVKGCDLLVVNEVGDGKAFERADNAARILDQAGVAADVPLGPKEDLADAVWDVVGRCWSSSR